MIELGKKYRTRDGREVRIYAVDGGGRYPVQGAYLSICNEWVLADWTRDGVYNLACYEPYNLDLIEVRPEVTVRHPAYLTESGVFATLSYSAPPNWGWRLIGAIEVTHDGEKLIKVEVVK